MYVQYGFLYLILSRPKLKVQAEPMHRLRGDSITDRWVKTGLCHRDIWVRPIGSSALQRVVNQ
jgi:hypothetical protein